MSEQSTGPVAMHMAMQVVNEQKERMNQKADQWSSVLASSLERLAGIRAGAVSSPHLPVWPSLPDPAVDVGPMPKFAGTKERLPAQPDAPRNLDSLFSGLDVQMDDLPDAPELPTLQIPDKPGLDLPEAPGRPEVDAELQIPQAPMVELPQLESLRDIPDFAFDSLPDFEGEAPTMDLAAPNVFINWAEPEYASELLDDLMAWVRRYMEGGTGLPAAVEDALFGRARDRISAETRRAVQEAVSAFAARGFSMPPGMLAKQINAAQEQGRVQAAELNRDILIEATKWEIENIRFAVTQGIALEQLLQNIYENASKRMFEVARFGAEAQITLFNAQVGLFNAQLQAYNALQQTFRIKLDAALARLEVWKTHAQSVQAHNQNAVEVFKSKFIAVQQAVEVFKGLMEAAKTKVGLIESQFQAYRADVQAYAERLGAEKVKFDAYESQIKGETAKAGMFEAQSRAWANTVQAIANKAEIKIKAKQLQMEGARTLLGQYEAAMRGWGVKVDAELKRSQQAVQTFMAEVDGWKAGAGVNTAQAEMLARFADMQARTNISYAQAQISEYSAKSQHAINTAQIAVESAKAMGAYSAQMAAGAMSAVNISAGISGSGSQSGSHNQNHNYSYER
ncbi:hypothetical protein EII18_08400 [Comamonadaceae bacterium OH3737_COT-264]|nr:hypothetical protein EII18_08400 [Comamonadaceae bacterium OH3737_COT-264]